MTPPEVFAIADAPRVADTPGWRVRVVDNLFPALQSAPPPLPALDAPVSRRRAAGVHEVIVEGPDHDLELADVSIGDIVDILGTWSARIAAAWAHPEVRHVMVFKNRGERAGASLPHPHSQLLATGVVPPFVATELRAARRGHTCTGRCPFCQIAVAEGTSSQRVILRHGGLIAFAHPAALFPYEVWIMPIAHAAEFTSVTHSGLHELAVTLRSVLRALRAALADPAFNLILHTAPRRSARTQPDSQYHWHIELVPRLGNIAGFEWGSGIAINHMPPEEAAMVLRQALEPPAARASPLRGTLLDCSRRG